MAGNLGERRQRRESGQDEDEEEEEFPDCNVETRLPIEDHKIAILKHIRDHTVTCLEADTGSGKSTKVPQYIVEYTREAIKRGMKVPQPRIVVTQPRRLAAKSLASRVARALSTEVGDRVGYRIGQEQLCTEDTEILFVTAGYLIQYLVHNPVNILNFTHIILDEVHERSLDSDLLSLIIKTLMSKPDCEDEVKLIVMSATLETQLFLDYFGSLNTTRGMEVMRVDSKSNYHVDVLYLEDVIERYHANLPSSTIGRLLSAMADMEGCTVDDFLNNDENMSKLRDIVYKLLEQEALSASVFTEHHRKKTGIMPYMSSAIDIIRVTAQPNHSTLVFLPGQSSIEALFDQLRQYEENDCTGPDEQFPWNCRIRMFALYRKIPFNDQKECFKNPPEGVAHVILATNIAESSITFPHVSVVLDFGRQKKLRCKEWHGKRLQVLEEEYCSKASLKQRKGRTGRVCDGICIRFMTENIYDTELERYDDPEMLYAPLDKLFLQVKFAGTSVAPRLTPSEWLREAIQGPEPETIQQTVQCLADADALEDADERSEMTLLGRAIMSLPLDIRLCRIVFYGVLLGCPCDAAVMAASLQVEDPFTCPSRKFLKNSERFINSLENSMNGRWKHDDGEYSEPLMVLHMYKAWLEESSKPTQNAKNVKKHFCHVNSVMWKKLSTLENTVAEIMQTVSNMVPRATELYGKIKELLEYLPRPQRFNPKATPALHTRPHGVINVDKYFSRDITMLKAVLVAALSPMFVFGTPVLGGLGPGDPHDVATIELPKEPPLAGDIDALEAMVLAITRHATQFSNKGNHLEVTVEGERPTHAALPDVSKNMQAFLQCAEGRGTFNIPIPQGIQKMHLQRAKSRVLNLKPPKHPAKLRWELISAEGQSMKTLDGEMVAQLEWRNPLGNACHLDGGWCLGIAHDYVIGQHGKNKREKQLFQRRRLDYAKKTQQCNVSGVTLLPTVQDNLLAVCLLLTFLPRYLRGTVQYTYVVSDDETETGTEAEAGAGVRAGAGEGVVTAIHVLGYSLALNPRRPLTVRLMRQILDIQEEVEHVMRTSFEQQQFPNNMDSVLVLESDIPQMMQELYALVGGQ